MLSYIALGSKTFYLILEMTEKKKIFLKKKEKKIFLKVPTQAEINS